MGSLVCCFGLDLLCWCLCWLVALAVGFTFVVGCLGLCVIMECCLVDLLGFCWLVVVSVKCLICYCKVCLAGVVCLVVCFLFVVTVFCFGWSVVGVGRCVCFYGFLMVWFITFCWVWLFRVAN